MGDFYYSWNFLYVFSDSIKQQVEQLQRARLHLSYTVLVSSVLTRLSADMRSVCDKYVFL